MPRPDEFEQPSNDNVDPDEAWKRAQLILEAHAKISNSEIHPYDHPAASIRGLLTDLMHYCATRNLGAAKDGPDRLDFDTIVKAAKTDYQVQDKTMPGPDAQLSQRQKEELNQLNVRHEMHQPRPDFDQGELNEIHAHQSEDMMERHIAERRQREAARAAKLRAEIEADERARQREIEQGLRNE